MQENGGDVLESIWWCAKDKAVTLHTAAGYVR